MWNTLAQWLGSPAITQEGARSRPADGEPNIFFKQKLDKQSVV